MARLLPIALVFLAIASGPRDLPLGLDAYMPVPEDDPFDGAKDLTRQAVVF